MTEIADVQIRPATAADSRLIRAKVREEELDPTGLDWRNFKLAEAPAGQVIGICQVRRYPGTRELGSLVVEAGWRGQGVGAALIHACLAEQAPPVYLECVAARQPYYERFGFQRIPKRQAPLLLQLKSRLGEALSWLFYRVEIIVMRWDG
jgi:N-acetylglutamate synthase-like GNAT family acetyltransferase